MDDRVQSPICQRRFVLPGMECVSKLLGFRWGPTPTPRKPHGGEGTAARCSQVAKVPYMASSSSLRWLPSRHRHCFRRRLLRRAGERAWRPRPSPAILTTEQLQRVDDGRQASPRHTSRLPGSEGGLCRENRSSLARNLRSFLLHTRSFTVTGWGHVLLKQRLGLVVVDIHWPAKPRSLGGGDHSFCTRSPGTWRLERAFGVASTGSSRRPIIQESWPNGQRCNTARHEAYEALL